MGIILLLTILFIICVILFIICVKRNNEYFYNDLLEFGIILSFVIGIILLAVIFAISIVCIVLNSNYIKRKVRIEYSETVESLNNTRQYIETITDDYSRSIAVTEYNREIKSFKSDLKKEKNRLNNGWINWFTCSEYKKLDIDIVDYIK